MTDSLSAAQARRVFLSAQSLASKRPSRRVGLRQFGQYLATQGVLQLDTVNVLARAHYLPIYSRFGGYDTSALDAYLWGAPDGHSPHAFEHWGHEASVMPLDLLPAMHARMVNDSTWKSRARESLERERPGLIADVRRLTESDGPVVAADLEHLAPWEGKKGPWWDTTHVKDALDYLFITGRVAASRGRHFARTYDAASRAWGVPAADVGTWGLSPNDAHQLLFDRALAACGIGTPKDLADHFRQMPSARPDEHHLGPSRGCEAWAQSAVERGLATWVSVDGWKDRALLAADADGAPATHRPAVDPGRATGTALLSPFDPVCWYRPRLERMFGVEYRLEIYTPAPKRVYGYYALPFLLGDQIVARVDLKADRPGGALLVQSAWHEPGLAPGARRRPADAVASSLAEELSRMAAWLKLDEVVVAGRGDLAPGL